MNCKEMKTEGDHTWIHHDTQLMAVIPPLTDGLAKPGVPIPVEHEYEVRTSTFICFPSTGEECGATKTVTIKVGTNPQEENNE
tara:strand:- start:990 stop:1238 length:249 start_codon:yes stop_codon:yes gene_type:complete